MTGVGEIHVNKNFLSPSKLPKESRFGAWRRCLERQHFHLHFEGKSGREQKVFGLSFLGPPVGNGNGSIRRTAPHSFPRQTEEGDSLLLVRKYSLSRPTDTERLDYKKRERGEGKEEMTECLARNLLLSPPSPSFSFLFSSHSSFSFCQRINVRKSDERKIEALYIAVDPLMKKFGIIWAQFVQETIIAKTRNWVKTRDEKKDNFRAIGTEVSALPSTLLSPLLQ